MVMVCPTPCRKERHDFTRQVFGRVSVSKVEALVCVEITLIEHDFYECYECTATVSHDTLGKLYTLLCTIDSELPQ